MATRKLRPYQIDALTGIRSALDKHASCVCVLPTGTGKTSVASTLMNEWPGGNCLFLAHTRELVDQAADRLAGELGYRPVIEMGLRGGQVDLMWEGGMVVVGSVQSMLTDRRLSKYESKPFDLIVIDEAHRATSRSYRKIVDYFTSKNKTCKVVGLTATPNRADGTALGLVFEQVGYAMDIPDAISNGWLVPVRQRAVVVSEVEITGPSRTNELGEKDFTDAAVESVMIDESALVATADPLVREANGRPTIVFCATVRHAHELAAVIDRYSPGTALAVDGETPKEQRDAAIARFKRGEIQFLCNAQLFVEGFDAPTCSCVAVARPTKSTGRYCLSADTEILTDRGWVGLTDWDVLLDGRSAAGYNRDTGKCVWTPIKDRHRRPLEANEGMYEYESGQVSLRVTATHRLLWRAGGDERPFQLIEAIALADRRSEYEIPVSAIQDAPGVPLTDSELEFVGWMMTDGTTNKKTGQVLIRQAAHQPWLDRLEATIKACGFRYTRREYTRKTQFSDDARTVEFSISKGNPVKRDSTLTGWGRLAPWIDKDLSPLLENVTADQLAVLLEAMHLGDGAKQVGQSWTRRSYHIATARKAMADRLQSLCVRRGFRCHVAKANYNANPLYILHIKRVQTRYVGGAGYADRPILKASPTTPGETVWCVTTGTSTIVTRRNGKVVYMGQTQMVGRGLRPLAGVVDFDGDAQDRQLAILTSEKSDCLVLDFVNAGAAGLVTVDDILGGDYDAEVREVALADRKSGDTSVGESLKRAKFLLSLEREMEARAGNRAAVAYETFERDGRPVASANGKAPKRGTITDGQLGILVALGMDPAKAAALSSNNARGVIDSMKKTHCTDKQRKVLLRAGIDPAGIGMDRAGRIITALKENNWQRPEVVPE